MSVLIEKMEMPKNCEECPFLDYEQGFCFASSTKGKNKWFTPQISCIGVSQQQRHKDCPLVEVPPHGRLIDADEYEHLLQGLGNRDYRRGKGTIQDAVKFLQEHYTPTVIESEE